MIGKSGITNYIRGFFYALTVVLGLSIALREYDNGNLQAFWQLSVVVSLIFFVELYTGWEFRKRHSVQKKIKSLDEYGKLAQFTHHAIIPLGLYISLVGFAYFNPQQHLRNTLLLFILITLTVLFTHIRAFYQESSKLIEQTNYVYDLVKFIIFFATANMAYNFGLFARNEMFPVFFVTLLAFVLMFLTIFRYEKLEAKGTVISLALAATVGLAPGLIGVFIGFNPLRLSFVALLIYYMAAAVLHHLMEGDLNLKIVLEYTLVLTSAIVMLFGLVEIN